MLILILISLFNHLSQKFSKLPEFPEFIGNFRFEIKLSKPAEVVHVHTERSGDSARKICEDTV